MGAITNSYPHIRLLSVRSLSVHSSLVWKLLLLCLLVCLYVWAGMFTKEDSFQWEPFVQPAFAEDAVPAGKIRIDAPVYDFASVSEGEVVSHAFSISNEGPGRLEILRIVPGCGCTVADLQKKVLQPGESTTVQVRFDTKGFSGKKERVLRLYTSDPQSPISSLSLIGEIRPDIMVEPRQVFFEALTPESNEQDRSTQISVRVAPDSGVRIKRIFEHSPYFDLHFLRSTETEQEFALRMLPNLSLGEIRDRVIVELARSKGANPGPSAVNIPVFARVKGVLTTAPPSLAFGILQGESPISRTVKFKSALKTPIAIERIEANHPAIQAEWKAIREGQAFLVTVSVDPKKVQADVRSTIEIITDNKDYPSYSLSVYGVLPPKVQADP